MRGAGEEKERCGKEKKKMEEEEEEKEKGEGRRGGKREQGEKLEEKETKVENQRGWSVSAVVPKEDETGNIHRRKGSRRAATFSLNIASPFTVSYFLGKKFLYKIKKRLYKHKRGLLAGATLNCY